MWNVFLPHSTCPVSEYLPKGNDSELSEANGGKRNGVSQLCGCILVNQICHRVCDIFFIFFSCPIICADLRGTAPALLVSAFPTFGHPGLIPHRGPTPRSPQEETSDRW